MSQFGDFLKYLYRLHEVSDKYASSFQQVNSEAVSKLYSVGVNSIRPLFEFVSKLKRRMVGLLPFNFASNLIPLLRPIFDTFSSDFESEVASNLESFRLSIFWRFKPLTEIIDKIVSGVREGSRPVLLNRRRLATYSIHPKVYPVISEEAQIISDQVDEVSRFDHRLSPRTPKLTIRRDQAYRAYDAEGGTLTSEIEAQDEAPLKIPFEVPIFSLTPNFVRVRRNVVSLLEKVMNTNLLGGDLSEFYLHRFSDRSRLSHATLSQMSNIGQFYFSIPVIKWGLRLLSENGVSSITKLQSGAVSSFKNFEELLSEGLLVGRPPRISSKPDYSTLNLPSSVFTATSSLSESAFSSRLLEIETRLKEVLGHFFRLYSLTPLTHRLPSIIGPSKIDLEDLRGEYARPSWGYPEASIATLAAVAPSASKVYSELVKHLLLPSQHTDSDKSKYIFSVRELSEMSSYSQIVTDKVAKSDVFGTQLNPLIKGLHGIIEKLDYHTTATKGVQPSIGLKIAKKLPIEEYYEMGKTLDVILESDHLFPLILDGYKQLSFATSKFFLQPSLVKMAEVVSKQQPIIPNLGVLDTFYGVSKEIIDRETGVQNSLRLTVDASISDMMIVERNAVERFPLDTPLSVPTLKLQEIISTISSIQPQTERKIPARIKRDRMITPGSSRSIEVIVDSLSDEMDIRDLERKIARILREEAKRYGLI